MQTRRQYPVAESEHHHVQANQYDEFQVLAGDRTSMDGAVDGLLRREQFRKKQLIADVAAAQADCGVE